MKKIVRRYIWSFLIFALLLLFPQSLSTQAELNMRVIISGIGIDFVDNQYQITAQVVLPSTKVETGGINAQVSQISAKGKSISDSINQVSLKIGKTTELSHMEYIVVGDTFFEKNLASELDYFIRNFKIKNSVMLLTCNGKAEDILSKMQNMDLSVALSLQRIWISTEENMSGIAKTYVSFVNDSFSECGTSVVDTIEFEQEENNSQNQNQETQATNSKFKVFSPLNIFKKGNYLGKISDKKLIMGYHYTNNKTSAGNLLIQDFTFDDLQNANINLRIDKMKKIKNVEFINGVPVLNICIKIKESHIDELASSEINQNLYKINLSKTTNQKIVDCASEQIKDCVYALFEYAKENNFDVFEIANYAKAKNMTMWQEYLSNLTDNEQYLQNIQLNLQVDFSVLR